MPTIYTEDKVGQAIEDHHIGTQGTYTGTAANSLGTDEFERRRAGSQTINDPTVPGTAPFVGFIHGVFDVIPRMVYVVMAFVGAAVFAYYALQSDPLNIAYFTSFSASAGQWLVLLVLLACGALAGWWLVPVALALFGLTLQLLYIFGVLAVMLGLAWIAFQYFS